MGELFIHPQRYFVHAPAGHVAAGDGACHGQAAGLGTVRAGAFALEPMRGEITVVQLGDRRKIGPVHEELAIGSDRARRIPGVAVPFGQADRERRVDALLRP